MVKKIIFIAICLGLTLILGYIIWQKYSSVTQITQTQPKPKPLLKYTYTNLRQRKYEPSEIKFTQLIKKNIWEFNYYSDGRKVSGLANLPDGVSTASALTKPVILMLHGFATQEEYYPGFGTERLAALLAKNGFVTLAPDMLGYGSSASPSSDIFEERFETYTTVLNLMASVNPIGLWGHSNGGQIALSVLEISGKPIPTVLWNPVTKMFPYSILYYTDSFDDQGKALRKALATFEEDYDVKDYSLSNYLDWINAPILLQQGESDEWVPKKWSDELNAKLKMKNLKYIVYPNSDHNMMPLWTTAANDTLKFFESESLSPRNQ